MENDKISPDTVLKNHGGAEDKNVAKIINEDRDDEEIDIIQCSPYYVPSNLPLGLKPKDGPFSVQNLQAKFDGLLGHARNIRLAAYFITYVNNTFEVSVRKKIDNSNIWEGLFLELKHESIKYKIIVGDLYKPPRHNNNAANINAFTIELKPILRELSSSMPKF